MPPSTVVRALAVAAALAVIAAAGCSKDSMLRCDNQTAYREARGAGPLRIPDDLSVPDETESLRIPEPLASTDASEDEGERCLEASPGLAQND